MKEDAYNAMMAELQHDKENLLGIIAKSKDVIREHEQIAKTTESDLSELENAMKFLTKRYLRENPSAEERISESMLPPVTIVDESILAPLEKAILSIIDRHKGKQLTARTTAEILQRENYPTSATDFITVVGNNLRALARNGYIGIEKRGRFVSYFSLKTY